MKKLYRLNLYSLHWYVDFVPVKVEDREFCEELAADCPERYRYE